MSLFDYTNLILIGGCTVFCIVKGFKKKIFKGLAFIYAGVFACFVTSSKYNGLLLSDIDIIGFENDLFGKVWTEKINSAIVTVLGTIIMLTENLIMTYILK